jgi:ATP-binding cassette subfamily B protein
MYYQAFQRGQAWLRDFLNNLSNLYEGSLFLGDLFDFLDLQPRTPPGGAPAILPAAAPAASSDAVVFDRVSYTYPGSSRKTLDDVSFVISRGQHAALVGENGSGKTTIVKLLCRLYDPTAGRITVDGIDLRDIDGSSLRREIGIIFQDYAQYQMTARENIWIGNTELPVEDGKVVAAARRTGAHRFLSALTRGYDTMLGKWFGNGAELSIGQWQKVALARALLRDAQIIVLDEPTSSLDARAEYEVFQNLRELAAGRTVILISHRFSTIRMADRIYMLKDGRIAEEGTHEELIKQDRMYAGLYDLQAQYYR